MKHLSYTSLFAIAMALPMAHANFPTASEPVQLSVTAINIPAGFGDGTAQAVSIEIPLRDSCYHYDKIERTDVNPTYHEFRVFGHLDRQGMCMEVFRYMQHDVILSNLTTGTHELVFVSGDGQVLKKQITVNKAQ